MKYLYIVTTLFVIGCTTYEPFYSSDSTTPQNLDPITEEIYEAVFRFQFRHNYSDQTDEPATVFLMIHSADPSRSFLDRFKDINLDIKPASKAHTESQYGAVVDRTKNNQHSIVFNVDEVELLSPDKALVKGGYYQANLSASWNEYIVELKNGVWIVTKDELKLIS